jgi:hypothetical protein
MDVLDLFLKRYSYKFPKGYIDVNDPEDQLILEGIFKKLGINEIEIKKVPRSEVPGLEDKEDEEEVEKEIEDATSKEDLINIIQALNLSSEQLSRLKKVISNLNVTDSLSGFLSKMSSEKNISKSEINKFENLIKDKGLELEFSKYFENPSDLDLNTSNFTNLIPGIKKEDLIDLYQKMEGTIEKTVSIGPGEVIFSILFKNVKKRESKGDLDVGGTNVELKASTGGAGAVIAKGYNRGEWSNTRQKGKFDNFVNSLKWDNDDKGDELKKEALEDLDMRKSWPFKLSSIYSLYLQNENPSKEEFIKGVLGILNNIYSRSSWPSDGEYFNLDSYFTDTNMDAERFRIDLSKELVNEYREHEKFDGLLFSDKDGNLNYLEGEDMINQIGKEIKTAGPSDDVPRLSYKVSKK